LRLKLVILLDVTQNKIARLGSTFVTLHKVQNEEICHFFARRSRQ
jgi:hypothetical protein